MPRWSGNTTGNVVRPQMAQDSSPRTRNPATSPRSTIEQTVDGDGRPDWLMLYTPGPKARAEYRAFARRGGPIVLEVEPLPLMAVPAPQLAAPGPSPLEAELIGRGITPAMAGDLVRDHGEEKVRAQIEQLDWLVETKPKKVADPAAWLVAAIRNGHAAPKGFVSKAERQRREEARQAQEREKAEQRRRQREQEARDRAIREEVDAYLKRLTPAERKALEAEALARAERRGAAGLRGGPGPVPRRRAAGPGAGARGAGAGAGGDPRRMTLANIRIVSSPNSGYSGRVRCPASIGRMFSVQATRVLGVIRRMHPPCDGTLTRKEARRASSNEDAGRDLQ